MGPRAEVDVGGAEGVREGGGGVSRRGVWVLGLLAVGLVLGRRWPVAGEVGVLGDGSVGVMVVMALGCGLAALGAASRGRVCVAALGLGVVMFGWGWYGHAVLRVSGDDLRVVAGLVGGVGEGGGGGLLRVSGLVTGRPRVVEPESSSWVKGRGAWVEFELSVRGVGEPRGVGAGAGEGAGLRRASGRLVVVMSRPSSAVEAGAWVEVEGRVRGISAPVNPGQRDGRPLAWQEGIVGRMRSEGGELVRGWDGVVDGEVPGVWDRVAAAWWAGLGWLRGGAGRALEGWSAGEGVEGAAARAMVGALLLGEREPELRGVESSFARLGLLHALSISGFHLVVLAGAVGLLARALGDRGRWEPLVVAGAVVVYVAVVPAESPIVRSACMVVGLMAARWSGRRYDAVSVLAWVAVVLLVWRPADLWLAGFQLSFGVTGALLWLGPRVAGRWGVAAAGERGVRGVLRGEGEGWAWALARAAGERGVWGWARAGVVGLTAASVVAWVVSAPAVAEHTGMVSVLGVVASVLVVPLITVVLWCGYAMVVVSVVSGAVGLGEGGWVRAAVEWVVLGLSGLVLRVAEALDGWWAVVWVPPLGWVWALAGTACGWWWLSRPVREGSRSVPLLALSVAVVGWPLVAWGWGSVVGGVAERAEVWELSVPGGRGSVVRGAGRWPGSVVVDCGSEVSPGVATMAVVRAARAVGAWRSEVVVLTGGDAAGCSGLVGAGPGGARGGVAGMLGVRVVLMPGEVARAARGGRGGGGALSAMVGVLEAAGVEVVGVDVPTRVGLGGGAELRLEPWGGVGGAGRLEVELRPAGAGGEGTRVVGGARAR